MRSHHRWLLATTTSAVLAAVASPLACSGKTAPLPSGASDDASTPVDAAIGGRAADCPDTLPPNGMGCVTNGRVCEYGDDFNPRCNTVKVCGSGGWSTAYDPGAGSVTCPSTPPSVPPNPAGCATTRSGVPEGDACSTTLSCAYDGSTCACEVYCPSYPIPMPDCTPDSGPNASCCDRSKMAWHCFDGPAFCPSPRPRLGTACTSEGASCAVSPPVECDQSVIVCRQGTWALENTSCPISSARFKRDISYVDPEEAEKLRQALMDVRLAEYRYQGSDAARLGFILEDMPPGSPAVMASRERVDLYGYVSMAVATLQRQEAEINALKADVAGLHEENEALRQRVGASHGLRAKSR